MSPSWQGPSWQRFELTSFHVENYKVADIFTGIYNTLYGYIIHC